jgi:uncharacterized protein (TIGR03437 family)
MFARCLWMQPVRPVLAVAISPRSCGRIRRSIARSTLRAVVLLYLALIRLQSGWAQVPQIAADGVVSAASYAQPISPGSVVSIFGANLASTTATAQETPLPNVLAGTSVTINGLKAPLYFVSPGQINLQSPSSLQSALDPSGSEFGAASVVVTTSSGSSAAVQVPLYQFGPAIFSLDGSGCGQAAALNMAADGGVSLNSPSNSVAPGDYIRIYGTGFGPVNNSPLDGTPVSPVVRIDGSVLSDLLFPELGQNLDYDALLSAGSATASTSPVGSAPGLWETIFQIPAGTREGCSVPIAVESLAVPQFTLSPPLSISIHSGRAQCIDPPIQSYGRVSLTKTIASGTANDGETDTLTAVFPSAPGLQPPLAPNLEDYNSIFGPVTVSRSCPVPGYTSLAAGNIRVQAPNDMSVTAQPIGQMAGVAYQQQLPFGFIASGPYTISASGGPVTFEAAMNVDSPIQIQTPYPRGTTISTSQALTVNWTGGTPGDLVKITFTSGPGFNRASDWAYADAGSGTLTIFPFCPQGIYYTSGPNACSLGLETSNDAQVIVEVSPRSPVSVGAQGITGKLQVSWTYRYVFGGLVLAAASSRAQTLFFEDFNGPTLNPIFDEALPDASWRFGAGTAVYIGASAYSFQTLDGASVIRLQNILDNAQRKGWSTSAQFPSNYSIRLEARLNTVVQSPTTGIDELLELWILDPTNLSRFDKVALSAPQYGSGRVFTAGSSITNVGLDTNFAFSDNTWYHLVITGSPTQDVRLSVYDDTGTLELIGVSVGHTLSAYSSGFTIGLAQSMGLPNSPYPTDVALDWINLTGTCAISPGPCPDTFSLSSVSPVF